MAGVRFSILGSCVTRDVFEYASDLERPVSYHAQTSILSIMSPPLPLADDDLSWDSDFAMHMVQADFAKSFFADLAAAAPDCLLVDFVDDRFAVLRRDDSWFVRSEKFVLAGGDALERYRLARVPRTWLGLRPLWRSACSPFAQTFRLGFPDLPVVVHRARAVADPRGARTSCDGIEVGVLNRLLDEYASWFTGDVGAALEIDLPGPYAASRDHRWGPSPFHYEDRYYRDMADVFRGLPPRGG
jgi:hypothetical protein